MILLHLTDELRKAGAKLTKASKKELEGQGMVASGKLKNSLHTKTTTSGLDDNMYAKVSLFSEDYGRAAEYGTNPQSVDEGKIAVWARQIGIDECAVPHITRAIEKWGTPTPPLTVRWCQDGELHDGGGARYSNNGRRTAKYGGGFVDVAYKLVRFEFEDHVAKGLSKDIAKDVVRKLESINNKK